MILQSEMIVIRINKIINKENRNAKSNTTSNVDWQEQIDQFLKIMG